MDLIFRWHYCLHMCTFCHYHPNVSVPDRKALVTASELFKSRPLASKSTWQSKQFASHHGRFGHLFWIFAKCHKIGWKSSASTLYFGLRTSSSVSGFTKVRKNNIFDVVLCYYFNIIIDRWELKAITLKRTTITAISTVILTSEINIQSEFWGQFHLRPHEGQFEPVEV